MAMAISQVAREWARPWWSFSYSLAWPGLLWASSGYLGWAERWEWFRFVLLVKFSANLETQPMYCTMTQASWNNSLGLDLVPHLWSWKSIWNIRLKNRFEIYSLLKMWKFFYLQAHHTENTACGSNSATYMVSSFIALRELHSYFSGAQ